MGSTAQTKQAWQEVVAEKRRIRAESIEAFEQGNLNNNTGELQDRTASMDGPELVASLTRREFSCEDLIRSHIHEACVTHASTNCLTEICFEEALASARTLDEHLRQHGTPLGPLHGIPTTLKDQFNVRGHDTTLGYVGRALRPADDDAVLVRMLRALGAVVLAKTNVPQSIMWCETENPLWGLTTSPLDPAYTPGGSTGGEAVLVARGASKLGFGTDLGGSVRIPAHMMGIYGLRPSHARLPYEGVPVSTEGQEHVPSSVGPLASSLATIHLAMRALVGLRPWARDARCAPLPWRDDAHAAAARPARPLVFGLLADDGVARPHPPVARALRRAADALRAAGHVVVDWPCDDDDDEGLHAACVALMDEYYAADGGEDVRRAVAAGGEPMIPHVARLVGGGSGGEGGGRRRGPISVYEYWQLHRRKHALQNAYLRRWNAARAPDGRAVDALLTPPMPHAAVPHRRTRWVGYTKVWNLLDYTALVLPGGHVAEEDLAAPWDHAPRGETDAWCLGLWREHGADMARLRLPVGIQIVGRRLEEEKVLGIGKVVDDLLRGQV